MSTKHDKDTDLHRRATEAMRKIDKGISPTDISDRDARRIGRDVENAR